MQIILKQFYSCITSSFAIYTNSMITKRYKYYDNHDYTYHTYITQLLYHLKNIKQARNKETLNIVPNSNHPAMKILQINPKYYLSHFVYFEVCGTSDMYFNCLNLLRPGNNISSRRLKTLTANYTLSMAGVAVPLLALSLVPSVSRFHEIPADSEYCRLHEKTQNPLFARTCGFKSRHRHQSYQCGHRYERYRWLFLHENGAIL